MLSIRPFVMPEITDRHSPRAQFPRKFDELTGQISEHVSKSGSVTARMGKAFNDPYADWVAHTDEYMGVVEENPTGNAGQARKALNADTIREMHYAFRRGGRKCAVVDGDIQLLSLILRATLSRRAVSASRNFAKSGPSR